MHLETDWVSLHTGISISVSPPHHPPPTPLSLSPSLCQYHVVQTEQLKCGRCTNLEIQKASQMYSQVLMILHTHTTWQVFQLLMGMVCGSVCVPCLGITREMCTTSAGEDSTDILNDYEPNSRGIFTCGYSRIPPFKSLVTKIAAKKSLLTPDSTLWFLEGCIYIPKTPFQTLTIHYMCSPTGRHVLGWLLLLVVTI